MAGDTLHADAFAQLYPAEYFAKFIAQSVRPDGRPLGQARPTSIGLGAVSTADSSALVKLGSSTALAGIKCEVMATSDYAPDQGRVAVQVEMSPLCSASIRPGRPTEAAQVLTEQMASALSLAGLLDLRQLCISPGAAAWAVYVDIYVLDADGSLHDACLLALVAALASLRLQAAVVDEASGRVMAPQQQQQEGQGAAGAQQQQQELRRLQLGLLPVSLTCGLYGDRTLVDLTAEEEALVDALVLTTVDAETGDILGMLKPGGSAGASLDRVQDCIEAAKRRGVEVAAILRQALDAAAAAAAPA